MMKFAGELTGGQEIVCPQTGTREKVMRVGQPPRDRMRVLVRTSRGHAHLMTKTAWVEV